MALGLVAAFDSVEGLLAAIGRLRARGYRHLEAFTPHPITGLEEALGWRRSRITLLAGGAGLAGAVFAFLLQWLLVGHLYPLDVGGRPPLSIPPFIVISFETMVLFASATAFLSLFWVNRLPRLRHPLFAVEGFETATLDRYWLGVDERDLHYDPDETYGHLQELRPERIAQVGERR
jgi:hypothetical protein